MEVKYLGTILSEANKYLEKASINKPIDEMTQARIDGYLIALLIQKNSFINLFGEQDKDVITFYNSIDGLIEKYSSIERLQKF